MKTTLRYTLNSNGTYYISADGPILFEVESVQDAQDALAVMKTLAKPLQDLEDARWSAEITTKLLYCQTLDHIQRVMKKYDLEEFDVLGWSSEVAEHYKKLRYPQNI